MSEIEKKLFNIFNEFIRDLSKTFPEIKNSLYRNYESCLIDGDKNLSDFPKLKRFLELIGDYEKFIVDKNLEFFDLEVEFLEEISFKRLWEKNISNKTRESIWKYLQTFQLININLKSSQELKNVLDDLGTDKEINVNKETVKDLKKMKKLSDNVQKDIPGENELDSMLSGMMDGGIGDIAKEVAKGLNIEEMFGDVDENSNPADLITKLMDPEKMGSIFNDISSVMDNKMKNGELTEDKLKSEAESMMNIMGDNPMFKNMMQGLNTTNNDADNNDNEIPGENNLTREEKKKKLREKINEKKNNR